MSPARKRGILLGGVAVMVAIVVVAVVTLWGGGSVRAASSTVGNAGPASAPAGPSAPTPTAAASQYLQALSTDDLQGASALTDSPKDSFDVLADAWDALSPTTMRATLGTVAPADGTTTTATYTATWTLAASHVWHYSGTFGIVRNGPNWRVHWTPAVLYPKLQAGQRLVITTKAADHPAVVDRDGKTLVTAGAGGPRLADQNFSLLRTALLSPVPASAAQTFALELVDAAGDDVRTLLGSTTGSAKPVRSTLSATVQAAAKSVVDSYSGPAVIVAIRPSDGGLLAAVQNGHSTSSPFTGLYAPGSTFKIVTASAALEARIANENSALPCPGTAEIGTRTIHNEDEFNLGVVTMHRAFAASCNTTFGQLASQLPLDRLAEVAGQYGLDADYEIPGLDTQTGRVGPAADSDQQVEDGIGQGTVLVSPFGEALMSATVAEGRSVTPRLWQDVSTHVTTGYTGPPASVLASLRPMMREVVTGGTATGLAHSGLVYGKTGTAEPGSDVPANGWFTGYRGDFAFVVFLAGADSSKPAVTLSAQFLAKVG